VQVEGIEPAADVGDVIGLYETLAGSGLGAAVTAITETRVLRIDRAGVFELLADHTDLLQGLFSKLVRQS
jgi:CRP-like cAMP-binding protein